MSTPIKRLLIKLSGEVLIGKKTFGIDQEATERIALVVKEIRQSGLDIAIVIGGGNIFRGMDLKRGGMQRTPADQMGMLATLMNGLAIQQALSSIQCSSRVLSALECPRVVESYQWTKALEYLLDGEVLIFVGGTGNPFFTTDTAAAMRANEIQADILLKATKVDGIYNKDPLKHPDAVKYERMTYTQVLAEKLEVMDATSITMCMNNKMPILVFNMHLLGSQPIRKLLSEGGFGTVVTS